MNYALPPEFIDPKYKRAVKELKNFIHHPGNGATIRHGMQFVTAMYPGEEIIGIHDGHLITSMRVIDGRGTPLEAPDHPPRIAGVMSGLKLILLARAHAYHLGTAILMDKMELKLSDLSGSDAT